jgi:outer membrane protein assembly factor BamB
VDIPEDELTLVMLRDRNATMNKLLQSTLAPALLGFLAAGECRADWPQFRGPQASGVETSRAVPTEWNLESGRNVRWKTTIPGLAHASPVVWGDRVYVATAVSPGEAELKVGLYGDIGSANDQERHEWRLLALELATGRVAWDRLGFEGVPKVKRHTKASHCNSTPATDGKRIVAIFGSEGLFCFNMEGQLVWKKDLGPMDSGFFSVPSAQWGFASSPVLHEDKVVVLCDVQTNSFLVLFDAKDGRELWRAARQDVPTWGTPTVVEVAGSTQILVNGWHHTGAYDFATGREIWRHDGGGDIPVPTPVVAHGLGYFTSAHGRYRPLQAIRLEAKGNITAPALGTTNAFIAWSHARKGNYMQTPLVVGDWLFACGDNGLLLCLEAHTGHIQYEERVRAGGDGFTASPVSDGRHLFVSSEQGDIYVIPASQAFSVIATNGMDETIMATPALSGGRLLVRTRSQIVAISSRP